MKKQTITVEDIERKQRLLAMLFKVFIAILILIGCVFVGWLISFVGYAGELLSHDLQPFSTAFPVSECARVFS